MAMPTAVDRPWPRQVLNFIAYAHLIPVIDGGILVRTNKRNTNITGADWKAQTVGYKRACLECLGQYKTNNAVLEKSGVEYAWIQLTELDNLIARVWKRLIECFENGDSNLSRHVSLLGYPVCASSFQKYVRMLEQELLLKKQYQYIKKPSRLYQA